MPSCPRASSARWSPSGTTEEVAQEIGKNLRVAGTSTADDAKAVAAGIKRFPKKVLEDLNKAGIQTECCRGPVTEAMPELKGVLPRGWPAGSPGTACPASTAARSRRWWSARWRRTASAMCPEPNEGPIRTARPTSSATRAATPSTPPTAREEHRTPTFLSPPPEDIATGKPGGMWGPRDNYFLTTAEGGTNDAGATSETFAESFAMHSGGGSRWPKLDAFWGANPWGV